MEGANIASLLIKSVGATLCVSESKVCATCVLLFSAG
jgi:hypothetical protein